MSDDIDRAQAREEEMRGDALAEFGRHHPALQGESATECARCGEPIPEARRLALPGVQTCIECQEDLERQGLFSWEAVS